MSDDFREEAEQHWKFIEKLLDDPVPLEKVEYLYIEAMVHGYKHAKQNQLHEKRRGE